MSLEGIAHWIGGFSAADSGTFEAVELKAPPCWVCGAVYVLHTQLPINRPVGWSTTRAVECKTCDVKWTAHIAIDEHRHIVVAEEG